mmetsp:Transcript_70683/g.197501  ORF Transcript_70683/g.197501 Transcript_70683/m.197501 type:complete len:103 (-) Transcript_70683:1578-1886(-)
MCKRGDSSCPPSWLLDGAGPAGRVATGTPGDVGAAVDDAGAGAGADAELIVGDIPSSRRGGGIGDTERDMVSAGETEPAVLRVTPGSGVDAPSTSEDDLRMF